MAVCDTHYWSGRTFPCEREQKTPDGSIVAGICPACNKGVPFREHVYVSAVESKTGDHFIFECTSSASKAFEDYLETYDTLRGCVLNAVRPKGYHNARVVITTTTLDRKKHRLPLAPDIRAILGNIWQLPFFGTAVDDPATAAHEIIPSKDGLDRMQNPPDNMPEPVDLMAKVARRAENSPPKKVK